MTFPLNLYLIALASAALVSALSVPLWRVLCRRIGLIDEPGERKIHSRPIPLAGGLAVLSGLCLPVVAGALLVSLQFGAKGDSIWSRGWLETHQPGQASPVPGETRKTPGLRSSNETPKPVSETAQVEWLAYGLGRRAVQVGAIILGALGMVGLGLLDDRYELRPAAKFTGQFFIAALVAAAGVQITLFIPNPVFHYAVTILWILTVTNALNFMDNMNGLCAGLGAIGAGCFALIAGAAGQYLVATMALLACGALLGFLPYNFPKATAFLGDSGSHLVGYLLAILAILPHFYTARHRTALAVLTPLLILAVPLLDLVWVIGLRWRKGKPFYVGDTNHLSHRLVARGLSKTSAVIVVWLIAALAGALACL